MSAQEIRREGERQAWFDLSCILGRGMEELGWGIYNHLPEPRTKTAWHAVRYPDRWDRFRKDVVEGTGMLKRLEGKIVRLHNKRPYDNSPEVGEPKEGEHP